MEIKMFVRYSHENILQVKIIMKIKKLEFFQNKKYDIFIELIYNESRPLSYVLSMSETTAGENTLFLFSSVYFTSICLPLVISYCFLPFSGGITTDGKFLSQPHPLFLPSLRHLPLPCQALTAVSALFLLFHPQRMIRRARQRREGEENTHL